MYSIIIWLDSILKFLYQACHINYHYNYSVQNNTRQYYPSMPEALQVGEHQYIERRVVDLWIHLMLSSWLVE